MNSNFWGPGWPPGAHPIVDLHGEDERVFFQGCNFLQWNNSESHETALLNFAGSGDYSVAHSWFWTTAPSTQVHVAAAASSAIISGCTFTHRIDIDIEEGGGADTDDGGGGDHIIVAMNAVSRRRRNNINFEARHPLLR